MGIINGKQTIIGDIRATGEVIADEFEDVQILTSANDTTTALNGTAYKSRLMITGTGVMQVYDLGVATAYRNGKQFTIINGTPEFVGVKNSDLTVFHRVPPRSACTCVLASNASAAGVWFSFVDVPKDPASGRDVFLDHCTGTGFGYNDPGFTVITIGAGTSVGSTSLGLGAGSQGAIHVRPGTTATGCALAFTVASASYLGGGCRAFEALVSHIGLSTAADEYISRHGFGNNILGGAHTDGCGFVYDHAGTGVNWQCRNTNSVAGGGSTTVDSGVVVTTAGQKLRVEVSSALTRVDYFINNVLVSGVGGITTRIPLAVTAVKIAFHGVTNTAYTGVVQQDQVDYTRIQSFPIVMR